jgi:ribonuclease HI
MQNHLRPRALLCGRVSFFMNQKFYIVTDGSAIGNPGPGGWAAVLTSGHVQWEISGACSWTTISEMELMAAIQALRSIPAGSKVNLCSDSDYLIRGMKYLTTPWRNQGWRNRRGLPLRHQGLWRELLQLEKDIQIRWTWVRGHSGHRLQDRADVLAYTEARHCFLALRRAA